MSELTSTPACLTRDEDSFEVLDYRSDVIDAIDTAAASAPTAFTENGMPCHASNQAALGSASLALANEAVRNAPAERIEELAEALFDEGGAEALAVMAAHVRDVRGGRGEREVVIPMLHVLARRATAAAKAVLSLLADEYGCWGDLPRYAEAITELEEASVQAYADQLRADEAVQALASKPHISLAAKWAPREAKSKAGFAIALCRKLCGDARPTSRKAYRKRLASLTAILDVPETKMCSGRWSEIEPAATPARCALKNRAGFANITLKGPDRGKRRSELSDRIACAEHFEEAAKKRKLKGGVLHPHELVREMMNKNGATQEQEMLEAQFDALVKETVGKGTLGKIVPLVDVSGSMSGTPMEAAIALGLLVATASDTTFRDRVMTFSEHPTWVKLDEKASAGDRARTIARAPWGLNTNFELAMRLIVDALTSAKVPPEDAEGITLLVLSDMQFDEARGRGKSKWETSLTMIDRMFQESGYTRPHIVFWNLRSTGTAPVKADVPGVTSLAGFSATYLRLFLNGGVDALRKLTPLAVLEASLGAERYDPIRAAVAKAQAGGEGDEEEKGQEVEKR